MMDVFDITLIFIYLLIKKFFNYDTNDSTKNNELFTKLELELRNILGNNLVNYTKTGSTVCDICDLDMAIIVGDIKGAMNKLRINGFINLTREKCDIINNYYANIKNYYDKIDFYHLKHAFISYTKRFICVIDIG